MIPFLVLAAAASVFSSAHGSKLTPAVDRYAYLRNCSGWDVRSSSLPPPPSLFLSPPLLRSRSHTVTYPVSPSLPPKTQCLDRYVRQPDPAYAWTDTGVRYNGTGLLTNVTWKGYALNVTSQTWLTPADTDRFTWWHILVVIIPSNFNPTSQPATADLGSMYMTGRCNKPGGAHGGSLPANGNDEDLLVSAYLLRTRPRSPRRCSRYPPAPLRSRQTLCRRRVRRTQSSPSPGSIS